MKSKAEINAQHRNRIKAMVQELKRKPCAICGESYPPCVMDFHHTDEDNKRLNISRMVSKNYGIETVLAEAQKCIVVCANCHRLIHYAEDTE